MWLNGQVLELLVLDFFGILALPLASCMTVDKLP